MKTFYIIPNNPGILIFCIVMLSVMSGPALSQEVSQSGAAGGVVPMAVCPGSYLSPSELYPGASGGVYTVDLISDCSTYTVSESLSWVSWTKSGKRVTLTISANSGPARDGIVSIGQLPCSIYQACGNTPGPAGSISGTNSVCPGQTGVSYYVSPITNATGYSWTLPSGASIASGANTNSITVNYSSGASSGNISVRGTGCGNGASSPNYYVTVNSIGEPGGISGPLSVCQGSVQSYSISPVPGANYYAWTLPPGASGSSSSNSISVTFGSEPGYISVRAYNYAGCSSSTSSSVLVGISTLVQYNVTGGGTICQGSYTSVSLAGSYSGRSYYLYLNGSYAGSQTGTGGMITWTNLYLVGTYTVKGISDAGCEIPMLGSAVISLYPPLTASISGGSTPVCYNTSPGTFTATGGGGTGSYTYLWYKNGASTGITTQSYNPGTLQSNSSFYCAVTSGACGTVNTSTASITVHPNLTASISGGTSTVCYGTSPGTFTATGNGGTGSYTYQWYKNGSPAATTRDFNPGVLFSDSYVYCAVTSGSCGTVNTTNNYITVLPALTASISSGISPVCYNASPGTLTVTRSGGDGSYSYQWYKNGSPTVTTQNYNPGSLTANSSFYCTVTSGSCVVNTSTVNITVHPELSSSINGGTSPVCYDTSPGTFTANGNGGTGTYTYLWYKDGLATETTTQTYNPGALNSNTEIYCAVTSGSCGTANTPTSNIVVNPLSAITIQPSNAEITPSQNATFSVIATGVNLHYQWQYSYNSGTWTNLGTDNSQLTVDNPHVFEPKVYRCYITSDCGFVISESASVIVNTDYLQGADIPSAGRELSTSYVVGTTTLNVHVNQSGASNMSIPVFASPGTNGMFPSLSVFYSSQSGNGILGYGWHLGGLSSITRTGRVLFYDNEASGVTFTASDKFNLDGERLMLSDGTYGTANSVYFSETNPFSKITAYGTTGNGPTYFKQETKDGVTYEYGNSVDSRHFARNVSSTVYEWLLTRTIDNNGNYIRYNYSNAEGEYWLRSIVYTGNDQQALTPYDSLVLNYTTRSADKSYFYAGQGYIPKTKLLKYITVYCEGIQVRKYEFDYTNGFYSQLVEITEYDKNGNKYNPIVIDWGNEGADSGVSEPWISRHETDYGTVTGDFNGDGIDELAYWGSDPTGSYLTVYKVGRNNFQGIYSQTFDTDFFTTYPKQFSSCSNGDLDGDGTDDLVFTSTDSLFIYYGAQSAQQMFSRHRSQTYSGHLGYSTGDFNGDGIGEIEAMNSSKKLINFDGDSRTDKIIFSSSGYELTTSSSSSGVITSSILNLTHSSKIFEGDFNGDSQTDLLVGVDSTNWQIWDYNGTQYSVNDSYSIPLGTFNIATFGNVLFVVDINNDGKSDIIKITSGSGQHIWNYYLSKGQSFKSGQLTISTSKPAVYGDFLFGDFNGEGQLNCFYNLNELIELKRNDRINFVESAINGLNHKYDFNYKYIVKPSEALSRPQLDTLIYETYSGFVVNSLTHRGSDNVTRSTGYSYSNPIVHIGGKGFIGFANQTITDNLTNFTSNTKLNVDETRIYAYPSEQITKDGTGSNISEQYFTGSKKTYAWGGYLGYISRSISKDLVHSVTDTTDYYYDAFGNDTLTILRQNGNQVTETRNVYIQKGSWCPSRVSSTVVTRSSFNDKPPFQTRSDFSYDDYGRLIRTKEFAGLPDSLVTRYTYNAYGNAVQKRSKTGNGVARYESFGYDQKQRFATTVTLGNLVSSYVFEPATGALTESTEPNGLVTSYINDGFGRQTDRRISSTKYLTTQYAWSVGTPEKAMYSVTQSDGITSVITWYGNDGKLIRTSSPGFNGTSTYIDKQYSTKNELTKESRPYFSSSGPLWNEFSYDDLGRLFSSSANGATISYAYDNNETTTTLMVPGNNRVNTVLLNGAGQVVSVTRNSRSLGFDYDNKNRVTSVTPPGTGSQVGYGYDSRALLTGETDPDRGTTGYRHNSFGELVNYETANGDEDSVVYDHMGRDSIRIRNSVNTTYTYYTTGNGKGRLSQVSTAGKFRKYSYDIYGHVTRECDSISATESFPYIYHYDDRGRLSSMAYPGGFTVTYHYNGNGYLEYIRRASDNSAIWQCNSEDAEGNITQYSLASGNILVDKSFNSYGYLKSIRTSAGGQNKQWLTYSFDKNTGDLLLRRDSLRSLSEDFGYDVYDQLRWSKVTGQDSLTMSYDEMGNITFKSDVGQYYYNSERVHAVDSISGSQNLDRQNIEYNNFNKPVFISDDRDSLIYQYNVVDDRIKTLLYDSTGLSKTTWYAGLYEKAISGSVTKHYYYINGPDGPIALAIQNGSETPVIYYICKDHLGSITGIMNSSGVMLEEYNYDPWGKRRNPADWSYANVTEPTYTQHGFTGHEHLDMFNLINMNGRVYDSEIARFINPDPVIQDPYNFLNYNRYTYCLNNPLKYSDPSGYRYTYQDYQRERAEYEAQSGAARFFNNYVGWWQNLQESYAEGAWQYFLSRAYVAEGTRPKLGSKGGEVGYWIKTSSYTLNSYTGNIYATNNPGSVGISLEFIGMPNAQRQGGNYNDQYAEAIEGLAGKPYIWGQAGPNSFDCSGTVCYGVRKLAPGFVRTTADQLYKKYSIQSDNKSRGSLIFYDYTSDGTLDHVTTILNSTQMLHPSQGAGVLQIQPLNYLNSYTDKRGGSIYFREMNWNLIINR